jgi:hypothetical protein
MPLILSLVTVIAGADPSPPPTIPTELTVRPGRIASIQATTSGATVRWLVIGDHYDLRPLPPDGKETLFVAPNPGRYLLFAWTSDVNGPTEAARCVITVAEPPPPPQPDALIRELAELDAQDRTPDKARHRRQLAAVYREAVRFTERGELTTTGELARRLRSAVQALLPDGTLEPVRQRIAQEIRKTLPDAAEQPLTPAVRQAAVQLFTRIATALESIP